MSDIIAVRPEPTDAELAAILTAFQLVWPRPVPTADPAGAGPPPWRFAGRWWDDRPAWPGWT